MSISLKAWGEYAHRKVAIHLAWLGGERLTIGYENNLISTSLGWPLSYLNLRTPMKIGGLGIEVALTLRKEVWAGSNEPTAPLIACRLGRNLGICICYLLTHN